MIRTSMLVAALVAAALAGCGGQEPDSSAPPPSDAAIVHVHGLGVDPADESLVVATHSGLFRAPADSAAAAPIGDKRQDTMGFTVVGPKRYLGSGHPDVRDDLPPLLGLIRSTDGGESWKPVSLLGEADFHALRAAGRWIFGLNSADGLLYVSADAGETWQRRTPPEPLADFVSDPADPRRLIASGKSGVHLSPDAGATWRKVSARPAGLLAWPAADRLYLVDGRGALTVSRDGGRRFTPAGRVDGPPAAFAAEGEDLYVATHDNAILVSRDGGRSWRTRVQT